MKKKWLTTGRIILVMDLVMNVGKQSDSKKVHIISFQTKVPC